MNIHTRRILFIIMILIIAALFRIPGLSDIPPGLYPDEAINGNNALEVLRTKDFKVFYPENNGREGLYITLTAGILAIFGNEIWALRLLSAIFGVLTVLGTYLLAREITKNEGIALLAAFFLAVSFWHISFSRIAFRAIMAPFFLTFGFYFLWMIFKERLSQTKKTIALVLGGILFGAGFHSYIAYRIMPLLLFIPAARIWVMQGLSRIGRANCLWCLFALFLFFTFIAGIPLGAYYLEHPADFLGRTSQISIFQSASPLKTIIDNTVRTIGMFWFEGDGNWRHNFSGAPQLWGPIGVLFFIGILRGIKKLARNRKEILTSPESFLFGWIILGLLPVIFSNEGIPHALRAILVLPPVMIITAQGLFEIIGYIQNWLQKKEFSSPASIAQIKRIRIEFIGLLFVFLLAMTAHTFNQYVMRWANLEEVYYAFNGNYRDIGLWLKNQPHELEKYVIINTGGVEVPIPQSNMVLPMPAQTVMFITDSWAKSKQDKKNIHYLRPEEISSIKCETHCVITMLEIDRDLREQVKNNNEGFKISIEPGFPILKK